MIKFNKMVAALCCLLVASLLYATPPDTLWVKKVHPEGNGCNSVAFSKDGSQLLAGTNCHNAFAKLYQVSDGSEQWTYTDSSLMCFMDAKFSPNGERFAIMEEFGILLVFDYTISPPKRIAQVDTRSNASLALTFTPDNKSIITSGFDDSIRVFNLLTNTQTLAFGTHNNIYAIATNMPGSNIATGSQNGSVRIWDNLGNLVRNISAFSQSVPVRSIAFTPDGTRLFCTGQNGLFKSYFTDTWQLDTAFLAHQSTATGLSISTDGLWFATSGGQGKATLWSSKTYQPFHTLELPMLGTLNGVAIAPNAKQVAVASSLGYAALFDIQDILTGVKQHAVSKNPISVYPNPVSNLLWIDVNHGEPVQVKITNQLGQVVWQQMLTSSQQISTNEWKSGCYFIQCLVDEQIHLTKVLK
ncbi:MAG: T9SS C-terminal target domain-containing protein [Bacteroidetes bacterium]|nr:MAG: T9SS C-terminal target domain-containing protein [Bacteroidota bacterium]